MCVVSESFSILTGRSSAGGRWLEYLLYIGLRVGTCKHIDTQSATYVEQALVSLDASEVESSARSQQDGPI